MHFGIYLSRDEEVSDNSTTINYDLLTEQGVKMAFIESSRGNQYVNPCLDKQVQAAKDHGWRVVLSHLINFGIWGLSCDELKEAHAFWNVAKNYPFDGLELNLSNEKDHTGGYASPSKIHRREQFMFDELKDWTSIPTPKPRVHTYTSKSFVETYAISMVRETWFAKHPLHIADWIACNRKTKADRVSWADLRANLFPTGRPLLPSDHNGYIFWQFTGEKYMLDGLNNVPVKLSLWNGSWNALADWFGKAHTPEPGGEFQIQLPSTCPDKEGVEMTAHLSDVWIHNRPDYEVSTRIQILPKGSTFLADPSTLSYPLIKCVGKEWYVSAGYLREV